MQFQRKPYDREFFETFKGQLSFQSTSSTRALFTKTENVGNMF